ncbi:MAG TPA: spherulation-specific family 4 protein [Pseudonocardiaceae bacterium]|jgi:hypothetical protein|nr:spherulation-specific family 4 protein [Pseudonocardiaceae bacterium]
MAVGMTPRPATSTAGLVVPAYFHPALADEDWQTLVRVAPDLRLVVLNVASGPGQVLDGAFVDVVARIRAAGVSVAGYVDTDYGQKEQQEILTEIVAYRRWYGADSVFFDRVASGIEHVPRYQALATSARAIGTELIAFNHGTHPVRDYAEHADLLGTFEGTWSAFQEVDVPVWVHDHPANMFFNLVYDTPGRMARAVEEIAAQRNVGSVYRTEHGGPNPWAHLPADFPRQPATGEAGSR